MSQRWPVNSEHVEFGKVSVHNLSTVYKSSFLGGNFGSNMNFWYDNEMEFTQSVSSLSFLEVFLFGYFLLIQICKHFTSLPNVILEEIHLLQ